MTRNFALAAATAAAVALAGCTTSSVAFTNGSAIIVRPEFLGELQNPDERAFVWTHELAHVLRAHGIGAALGVDRDLMERDADLWGARTAELYGYDPCAGARMLRRYGQAERALALAAVVGC